MTSSMRRMRGLMQLAALGAGLMLSNAAAAATCPAGFPNRPVSFVVGFGAGGGTDVIGRTVAAAIEQQQKWNVVVENKPGANGGVMNVWLKTRPNNGYTIGVTGTDSLTVNPARESVGYTWEEFDYLGSGMQTWLGMVALVDRPFNDIAGLVAHAKQTGRATISVAGASQELLIKQLATQYGVNLVAVPGAGAGEAMQTALGGHVDATTQGTLHIAQIKAGKMKQLASLIGRRVPYAPDSKTLAEQGVTADPLESHTIFFVPKGVDPAIKACLKCAIDEAVKSEGFAELMKKWDNEALNLGEDGLNRMLADNAKLYRDALGAK